MVMMAREMEIRAESMQEGIQRGKQENTLENLQKMIQKLHLTPHQAMDVLDVPEEERPGYLEIVAKLPQ